jgi:hypothetical protein
LCTQRSILLKIFSQRRLLLSEAAATAFFIVGIADDHPSSKHAANSKNPLALSTQTISLGAFLCSSVYISFSQQLMEHMLQR